MYSVFVMSENMIIDVIKCECDVMYIEYDAIRVTILITYTLALMSSIERFIDTDVCAICVMTQTQWL